MVILHQPVNYLIQCTLVGNVKLLCIVRSFFLGIAAYRCTGTTADLRDAKAKQLAADFLILTGGDDHSGVRYCQTDAGCDLCKGVVVDAVVKCIRIDIVGMFYSGHADSVRANAVHCLEVFRVHEESCEFIFIHFQSEQNAKAYIVDAAFHRTVHSLGMVCIVVLRSCGMQLFVALFVVGLLEQNVGSDAGFFQFAVVFHSRRGDIHIYAADIPIFVVD